MVEMFERGWWLAWSTNGMSCSDTTISPIPKTFHSRTADIRNDLSNGILGTGILITGNIFRDMAARL